MDKSGPDGLGPCATIDLSALRHNLGIVRKFSPASRIMAVIKADAYGHGMLPVAKALREADMLAVARISEGVKLRESGIDQRIAVLEGFFEEAEIEIAVRHKLEVVIHQERQVLMLEQYERNPGQLVFWLKIDTGMHRLGVMPANASAYYQRLSALDSCADRPVLMTHFANADDEQNSYTSKQIKEFDGFSTQFKAETSLANSAGIIAWPDSHQDWVRPGIMLYGTSPMLGKTAADHGLQPVMTLSSQLFAVNRFKKGDCVGYGSSWCCPEDMPVGVVAVGYGDGYPRHAPSGTPVLVNGQRTQVVGRVSMDMVTVDLRGVDANEGDEVILWGDGLPAEAIAEAAGTITYELFCGVSSRVHYRYINGS